MPLAMKPGAGWFRFLLVSLSLTDFLLGRLTSPEWNLCMAMWTEYEGTTIGNVFPLTKLLQPEGRSALFSTLDEKGSLKLLRLIESHFDDEEILACWKGVAALNHPHLLRIEDYGKFTLDETTLVYAVMESADANLGEVLVNQRVTPAESRQLAESVASALEALHSHGFIHEHVEPGSIFAVGEVVKLRGDCIRETPEGVEGKVLKQRDIQNLCTVLLMTLTQQRTLEAAGPLPAPFDRIVPRGLRGELELSEIFAAFQQKPASVAPAAAIPVIAAKKLPDPPTVPVATKQANSFAGNAHPGSRSTLRTALVAGSAFVVLLCVWLGWHIFHHPASASVPIVPTAKVESVSTPAPPQPRPAATHPVAPVPAVAPPATVAADTRSGWRVIAYTYNREDQARHKAEVVAQQHPDLHPEVFTPTGRAPFLVSLGGVMSRDQAFAGAAQAHREGLPHDVYARHYRGQ